MKISKHIENSIRQCAKYNAIAMKYQKQFEEWFSQQGIDIENDTFRDQLIDSVELSDNPNTFIDYIKSLVVIGSKVNIVNSDSDYNNEWGTVRLIDKDGFYHVAIADGDCCVIFDKNEIEKTKD